MRQLTLNVLKVWSLWVLLLVIPGLAWSAPENNETKQRPKVGLVLSGGGALGLAHVGVLKVLEELHVPVDCIAGTSMGALVGGAYATGMNPADMEGFIAAADLGALFDDAPPRSDISQQIRRDDYRPLFDIALGLNDGKIELPAGASAGYKFELFLKEMVGKEISIPDVDFDYLPIPYRAVATDLESGEMKVFSRGELAKVMRASMSLPAVVAPTEIEKHIYVDGGLVRNLPIDVARELCGEVIIAVNLGTHPMERHEITNSLAVAGQTIILLTEQNVEESLAELTENDILISPDLSDFDSTSFNKQKKIIKIGEDTARSQAKLLSTLSVSPQDYRSWQDARQYKKAQKLTVTAIKASTSENIDEQAVLRDVSRGLEGAFDIKKLHREITEIYGRGDFSYVGYSIVPGSEGATIDIKADSKPWGPGYLKFGLGSASDFNTPTQLNLAASYRRTWMNSLGAEWRNDLQIGYDSLIKTEFLLPLQFRDGAFIAPYLGVRRYFLQFFQGTTNLGEVKVGRADVGLDVGVSGSLGEMRLGTYTSAVKINPDFGVITPLLPEQDLDQKGVTLSVILDQLDRIAFPRSGYYAVLDVDHGDVSGDLSKNFTLAVAGARLAKSFGKFTLSMRAEWGYELTGLDVLPVHMRFRLGGPDRLTGLYLSQLSGSEYDLETIDTYYQYAKLPSQLGSGIYFGASLQSAKINDEFLDDPSDRIYSAGVYLGVDTLLGALYLGYGHSSLDQNSWYFVIGPRF
jgi:NTE family protein